MAFLKSLAAKLSQFLSLYGGWGLFGVSFLDSSLVPLPAVNDLLLLHLSSQYPERAVFYALGATLGSVAGSYVLYGLARGGSRLAGRSSSSPAFGRARLWLRRNDFASILVISILPPPSPFKICLLAAGALRVNAVRFGLALLVGRGLRFGAEAFLGARFGAQAEAYLQANLTWVSLLVALLVVLWIIVYRRLAARVVPENANEEPRTSPSEGS